MSRIVLIHWNPGVVRARAALLRKAGHRVTVPEDQSSPGLRGIREDPPDVFVVDLDRRPSHGREVAQWFRQSPKTRHVPLLFAGGEAEKVERVRATFPDAAFTDWKRVRGAVRAAVRNPPASPAVPTPTAFYGGVKLVKKLGIRAGATVALLGAPKGFESVLGELPEGARIRRQARGTADVVMLFAKSRADLRKRLPVARRAMANGGSLWIAWPKKTSAIAGDLSQQAVRETGLRSGLVDYKIAAIDDTWSGLRFARRKS